MQAARLSVPLLVLGTATNLALLLGSATRTAPVAPTDRDLARSVARAVHDVADEVTSAVVSVTSRGLRGSGVLIDGRGSIVTNHHVVRDARRVRVTLRDGRDLLARVVGTDADSDLALLDLEGEGFPHARLSSEPPPPIGTWVLAIGNPMGLSHTVTFGIISAQGRAGIGIAIYEDFLQTDAAINHGNSGGPLVNLDGEVVGINTAVELSTPGASQGLGFAIPAYMVREVIGDLSAKGYVERGYFGIEVRDSEYAGTSERRGTVRVTRVYESSPAERAGIRVGDLVLAIAGTPILETRDLFDAVARLDPGAQVEVEVWRSQGRQNLRVDVGERPTATSERP